MSGLGVHGEPKQARCTYSQDAEDILEIHPTLPGSSECTASSTDGYGLQTFSSHARGPLERDAPRLKFELKVSADEDTSI